MQYVNDISTKLLKMGEDFSGIFIDFKCSM
jgi:hypothetical protein